LAARGLSNREIADRLFVSIRTVGNHLNHAYAKLGARGREDLDRLLRSS
jgi:DNA-binding CsgD family transcriptional regulator